MLSPHRILLRYHVEAVWSVQIPPISQSYVDLASVGILPPWRLYAAELVDGRLHIWRPDVGIAEREALRLIANEALALPSTVSSPPGISREVALQQIASPTIDVATAQSIARPLKPYDHSLIEIFEPGSSDYYLHVDRRPLIGVIVEGRLLSVAHSSRRTSDACELGIDTLPEARRRGYALAATVLWAASVSQEGLVPLYSALIENEASLRLAAAAGYRDFARIATIE
jgi:GNAT acetyltransferase